MTDIAKLLDDTVGIVDRAGVTWAIMGGCARNAYAEPRATKDVDLVVAADADRFVRLEEALAAAGFHQGSAVTEPGEPVPDLVLYRDGQGRRIDVLFAHTSFEQSALARRVRLAAIGETPVHVLTVEDLIVYKVIADRPQDRADIAAVVEAQRARGQAIDWSYVEHWCGEWDVSHRLQRVRAESNA